MKFLASATLAVLATCGCSLTSAKMAAPQHHRALNVITKPLPTMTFYVPLPEEDMLNEMFYPINTARTRPPIVTLLSLTVSTDKTVVWVDHWEDGYDQDVTVARAKTTEIWGDGDASNGCAPTIVGCTNSLDVLMAGTSIVISNEVDVPRDRNVIRYDGGDRIQSSFPVAFTRAGYGKEPGSVFAGAVEVYDTTQWGLSYEAPVGSDTTISSTGSFELCGFMFMAVENNTQVTLDDGKVVHLQQGESSTVLVKQADTLKSNKPIQVILYTGDIGSEFESRWYTLRAIESYSTSYVTPVGDSIGKTRVVIYNPGPDTLTLTTKWIEGTTLKSQSNTINAKQNIYSRNIPSGSGGLFEGNTKFVALSVTDTEDYDGNNLDTWSNKYDWGFPLVPRNELTSQVLIGLGYACTKRNCEGKVDRSPVWVTPLEDADIYIDYQNTGVNLRKVLVQALTSYKIVDADQDMSGATIFATKKNTGVNGTAVDFASAWGQDPLVSRPDQHISMDMGTVVPPFTLVKVAKIVDKVVVLPGEELTYTIRVSNVGHKNIESGNLLIKDVLDSDVAYVTGSAKISSAAGSTTFNTVADSSTGTKFPLDDAGYYIPVALPRRGGTVDIVFKVKVADSITTKSKITNRGTLTQVGGGILPFETKSTVDFSPAVKIDNTVYAGADQGLKCGTATAVEKVEGKTGSDVVYCLKITNTGKTHLKDMKVTTPELNFTQTLTTTLAPGASQMIYVNKKIAATLKNNANVVATPTFASGTAIPDAPTVTSTDPSEVAMVLLKPSIRIDNTVYLGTDTTKCATAGLEKVEDIHGSSVVYCFTVTNTGDAHLNKLVIKNPVLNGFEKTLTETLAPGQKTTVSLPGTIAGNLDNVAEVTGTPVLADGKTMCGSEPVKSSDPSSVAKLTFKPSILVENKAYAGRDGGKLCGTPEAIEIVTGLFGANVTYCFKIVNTGETRLNNIELVDTELSYSNKSIGSLAPGASIMLFIDRKLDADLTNNANVKGNPIMADGRDIPDLADVLHSDPSSVDRKNSAPAVAITNTVVSGNDGKLCGTSAAKEFVEGFAGTNVTFCFTIKNTGNTFLDGIVLSNPTISFQDATVARIAPGVATTVAVIKPITGSKENIVTVTANPTTSDGVDVPNAPDVTASDPSSVGEIAYKPLVSIANTVYLGENAERSCGTAVESVSGLFGAAVTYCFNVTNMGNTHLDNIRIGNDALSFSDQTTIKSLAPGASAIVTVPRKIAADLTNAAKVTARPIKEDKTPLPLGDVTHTDTSSVVRIAHKPSVTINNTVYIGATAGSCSKGVDTVKDIFFTDVTYCLRVTNNGDTHLNNIAIVDPELSVNQKLTRTLAPGESELVSVPGKIKGDLRNTATVTANPILPCGTDIAGIPDATHNDWSSVEKLSFAASVSVANTVYLGNDGGKSCATAGELAKGLYASDATFCFKVTNNGQTRLANIALSNAELSYTQKLPAPLLPGESITIPFAGTITATRSNLVNVTARPTTADGRDIVDQPDVKATDPSGVELVPHAPAVTIANTVYLGNDGGKSCGTSVESVTEQFGAAVTYCFKITNSGNSFLENVVVSNEVLNYSNSSLTTLRLAPGASTTLTVAGKIPGNVVNTAKVTATPCLEDGFDLPNTNAVTATDPSSVNQVAHKAGVNVDNTVTLGTDSTKCATNSSESVKGYPNTAVVYCFAIKNVGESHLKDVVIKNAELAFTDSSIKLLAPGQTKLISLPGTITKDLVNNAIVTGTPSLSDGTPIPNVAAVEDKDPSAVDFMDYAPKVVVENSVYINLDGGQKCGTPAARELVDGMYGTEVTYCFNITNKGDAPLKDLVIENAPLNYKNTAVKTGPLNPGEWVLVTVPGTITADLKNLAVVTATPTIVGLPPITSQDPSEVNKLDFVGGIKIVNKVYQGSSDNGAKCNTDAALEVIDGVYGTDVTYCFTITNTGDTYLADVVLTNDKLGGYKKSDFGRLAPGQTVTVSIPGTIVDSLVNSAVVVGNPVTATGQDIPDLSNVKNEDASAVKKLDVEASVSIANTVYLGKDGGKQCGTAAAGEVASDRYGALVTYCLVVSNTGQSHLKNVVVEDVALGFADKSITLLAPGANKTLIVEGTIVASVKNVATVQGTAALSDGSVIPNMAQVTATDPSAVERIPHAPRIEIDNLVLLGSDATKCDSAAAVDYVEHYSGALVTYCFEVTNKGDTHLADIKIDNADLKFVDTTSIKKLAPGESAIVAFASKIVTSLKNVAVVTGNPVLPNGLDIPDTPDATWSDGSAVGKLEYYPAVKVDNKVYVGTDGGASCASHGVEKVVDHVDTDVVYCFTLTNTGDTYLNHIQLTNPELKFSDSSIAYLAPKETKTVVFASSIPLGNLTNNVVVVANPSLQDGTDISGAQDVTATDPSTVSSDLKDGTVKGTDKPPYSPPKNGTETCLQDKWQTKPGNSNGTLLCSTKHVYLESVQATPKPLTCKLGETVTLSVDAKMRIEGPRRNLGWYVAADGGDALTGQCIVNGLQKEYQYPLVDAVSAKPAAGKVVWLKTAGGDDDTCGDVLTTADQLSLSTPLLVNAVLPCTDDNDDGVLDVALCFTWRTDGKMNTCSSISDNVPGSDCSCYCTRYDIPNVEVEVPVKKC